MPNNRIAVTAIGLTSSLGAGADRSCAAARAGLTRLSPLVDAHVLDEESGELVPIAGHPAAGGIVGGFQGAGRLAALAGMALRDLFVEHVDGAPFDAPIPLRVSLGGVYYLRHHLAAQLGEAAPALPASLDAIMDAESAAYEDKARQALARHLSGLPGIPIDAARLHVAFGEQACVADDLAFAIDALSRGDAVAMLVGGVDTLVEPKRLQQLVDLELVKTPVIDAGFFPGEAAGFVLLEPLERARGRGAAVMGVVESVGRARESLHRLSDRPPVGIALAEAARAALGEAASHGEAASRGGSPGLIVTNLNGDHWQSWDWGHALTRIEHGVRDVPQWHPAEAFGEVGAATLPAMVCVAARAFQRGYAGTDSALLCVSGSDGAKASAVMSRSN